MSHYDKELVQDILSQILEASDTILQRFAPIRNLNDFLDTPQGQEKLDSICMLLIAIGESLKNIDKITDGTLLARYPEVDWKGAKGMRDIITYHYFDIDAEEIFWVCKNALPVLAENIRKMLADLQK
jgi:uncharacterized protein with HEPN domain